MSNDEVCRLLLVEDSRGDAMVIQALLAEAGRRANVRYVVEHVDSYAAARSQLQQAMLPFDVVLLDLGLPDSEGLGPVEELGRDFPALAVVVMTGLEDSDSAMEAVASGAQEYLPKGKVKPDELARVLRHAILRHRLEQTLRESEAEHRALFESNPHPIWVCEQNSTRFLAANAAAVRQYGWSAEEFLGKRLLDLSPEDELGEMMDFLRGDAAVPPDRVWRHRTRNETELQVQLSLHSLEFFGEPAHLLMVRHVTDSARLGDALARSERRFLALFEAGSELRFEHDMDGTLLRVNQATAAALGYLAESLVDMNLRQLVSSHFVAHIERYLDTLRDAGAFDGALPLMGLHLKRRAFHVRAHRIDAAGEASTVMAQAQQISAPAPPAADA